MEDHSVLGKRSMQKEIKSTAGWRLARLQCGGWGRRDGDEEGVCVEDRSSP